MNTVLIIEDMPLFAKVVASTLRGAGYEVLLAADGREGLNLVRSRRPSLVLLDNAMPVMSGMDALRAIRADADPAVAATPVVMVSATSDRNQSAELSRLGVTRQLLKSRFSLAEVVSMVNEATATPGSASDKHTSAPTAVAASPGPAAG